MEASIVFNDHRGPSIDRLIAELSSGLFASGEENVDALINTMLARIGDALHVDSTTLLVHDGKGEGAQTYRWAHAAVGADAPEETAAEQPWFWDRLQPDGEPLVLERIPEDLPPGARTLEVLERLRRIAVQSAVIVPIAIGGDRTCVLAFEARSPRAWPEQLVARLRLFAEVLAGGVQRRMQTLELREARTELETLTPDGAPETEAPEPEAHRVHHFEEAVPGPFRDIVGESAALREALTRVQEVSSTNSTVLLLGETGTGKELFARAIQMRGPRRSNAFVTVNCAALPPTLIESELFGHTRGAFTGAVTTRQGRFELAHHGTLFLDEIGDLPLELQTKLLRVLQEGSFERLGSSQPQKVDVRIIAATHRDLRRMMAEGTFRDDLFYRLSVFPIRLPALRERREDIPSLVWSIIRKRQRLADRWIKRVPEAVMERLTQRNWPGNVRELENVIERALIHTTGTVLTLLDDAAVDGDNGATGTVAPEDPTTLSSVERAHIQDVLRTCGWRINGAGNAAERLGLHPNTLRFRMKKLGIVRESSHPRVHFAGGAA
jgi:transcriptional regulator with GAF, ATPase, and Fis domain